MRKGSRRAGLWTSATSCTRPVEKNSAAPAGIFFHAFAGLLFPDRTVAELRTLTGKSERSIKYYLAGRHEAPASVLAAMLGELGRRLA